MKLTEKIEFVFTELVKRYPGATTELHYETPFQLLVAVQMSAQTTDKQVNKVTAHFFDTIKQPEDLLKLSLEEWTKKISAVNYYNNKAKNIYKAAQRLVELGSIPDTLEGLIALPGVGEKTAKVILQVLYNEPVIAVDTHVHRVLNRLGIVKTTQPLQTSKLLEKIIPESYKGFAHHVLIFFGRYHCTARNPKCESCPFTHLCIWYKHHRIQKKPILKKKK